MTDQELILALAADLRPARPHATERAVALAVAAGGTASLLILVSTLGIQPGLGGQGLGPFAVKVLYGLTIFAVGAGAALRLARPAAPVPPMAQPLAWAFVMLASLTAFQYYQLQSAAGAFGGGSWPWCSLRIAALALPILAALLVMMRRQAPVQLRRAGAAAGLAAGALASVIYALACTEQSVGFVLVWYSAGIAAMAAIGWLLGPKLLRW